MSIVVFGASGHGKVVADAARAAGLEVRAFLDDAPTKQALPFWGLPVLGFEAFLSQRGRFGEVEVALGVGDNHARARCAERIAGAGLPLATLVHPSAVVAPSASLGAGTVVMALVAVNPDARVGGGAILNTGCVVEHDCRVGDFAHLSPNAALGGGVSVGDRTHVGLGAVVLPLVRVGSDVRVGAGAVVHRSVADGLTVVGVPAHPLERAP